MKFLRLILLILVASSVTYPQTIDLGQNVFFNNEGPIVVCIDAAVAVRKLDKPYIMFMVFMGAKGNGNFSVHRDDVVMVYKGQEYRMPSLEEWRKEHKGANNDIELYARLGKESLALSQMRFWRYQWNYDFFPVLGKGPLPSDQVSMSGSLGSRTKVYFKNPGFQKGDEFVIKVTDHNNPEIVGLCAVVLDPK
ncbi:MAG: hypothetical protein OEW18_06925 [Candidatus Aminicenantes bacterium]|nr:hypothetical protein [Candidatus Aminicenantes bacterium]